MASEFCPKCGAPRTGAFRFCRSCQFDFDATGDPTPETPASGGLAVPPVPNALSANQDLGRQYVALQNFGCALAIGRTIGMIIGLAIALYVGAYLIPNINPLVALGLICGGPVIGLVLGDRVAAKMLAR